LDRSGLARAHPRTREGGRRWPDSSVAAIGAVRWALIDQILRRYYFRRHGKPLPEIDFSKLSDPDKFAVFQGVNENHYRYYQYYSNTLVAIVVGSLIYLATGRVNASWSIWAVVILSTLTLLVASILFVASADCLFKYHERASKIAPLIDQRQH